MFSLLNKRVLLTGASGGLGQAMAKAMVAAGAHVIITGTREGVLQELASQLDGKATVLVANLHDSASAAALVEKAEAGGAIDVLVNNAGITRDGLLMRMKDDDWAQVLEVNLTAVMRLTRALIRPMLKRQAGSIINISSVVGVTGNAGQTNYCASKAGLIGFSKALALEVASRSITVNCIAPGFIKSAMTDELNEAQKQTILAKIPMARMGSGDDIAAAVVYLASDAARYVTGQTIHVNGGMAMV